ASRLSFEIVCLPSVLRWQAKIGGDRSAVQHEDERAEEAQVTIQAAGAFVRRQAPDFAGDVVHREDGARGGPLASAIRFEDVPCEIVRGVELQRLAELGHGDQRALPLAQQLAGERTEALLGAVEAEQIVALRARREVASASKFRNGSDSE